MTAHAGPIPVPARITLALDAIGAEGPEVDIALGGVEPMVDQWEAGELVPTREQVERLAALTGRPIEYFYLPAAEWEAEPTRFFLCDRSRRKHGLTVVESHIDWDGVLQVRGLTPPKPSYRPRKRQEPAAVPVAQPHQRRPPRGAHVPHEDPQTPGVCIHCPRPVNAPNRMHLRPGQLPPATPGPQDLAAGEVDR